MNDKIKLFNEQAIKYAQESLNDIAIVNKSGIMYNYNDLYTEKFAELIVGECIDVLENRHETFKGSRDHYGSGFKSGLDAATRTVKEHFGVEL